MKNYFRNVIYSMATPLLKKRPADRQALENALVKVEANEGRIMAAFRYEKVRRVKSEAKRGEDFVAIEGIDRDIHMVLIERVEAGKNGIMIFGKDFMRGDGNRPYALRKFRVSGIKSFSVTGTLPPLKGLKPASEAA